MAGLFRFPRTRSHRAATGRSLPTEIRSLPVSVTHEQNEASPMSEVEHRSFANGPRDRARTTAAPNPPRPPRRHPLQQLSAPPRPPRTPPSRRGRPGVVPESVLHRTGSGGGAAPVACRPVESGGRRSRSRCPSAVARPGSGASETSAGHARGRPRPTLPADPVAPRHRRPRRNTAETLEQAMPKRCPISHAVRRLRRSARMRWTLIAEFRCGTWCGAEGRSCSPASPSSR